MKAVVIATSGDPQVLQVQEVGNPEIGDVEVLIRVEAAAINQADTLQRKGLHPPPKGGSPYPGLECSGIIEAVGKVVVRWKVGDQVCALLSGGEGMLKKWLFQLGKFFLSHWCFSEGCCWYS